MFKIKSNLLIRSLLFGLLFASSSVAVLLPSGTTAYLDITVNHAQVTETDANFLYQFKVPLDAKMKAACDSAKNFVVCTPTDTSKFPRVIKLYTLKDTLLLYVNAPKSTTVDQVLRLCASKTFSAINTSATFTNAGIIDIWRFDEDNGSTVADDAGGVDGTVISPATIGNVGFFGNAANFGTGIDKITTTNQLIGAGNVTVRFVIYPRTSGRIGQIMDNGKFNVYTYTGSAIFVRSDGSTQASSGSALTYNTWSHWMITRTSTGIVNYYLNGVRVGTANQSSGTPTTSGTSGLMIGNRAAGDRGFDGLVDNVSVSSGIASNASALDRYIMMSSPSTFATFGSTVSVRRSSGGGNIKRKMSIGTKLGL
jgi:hypothetical protein